MKSSVSFDRPPENSSFLPASLHLRAYSSSLELTIDLNLKIFSWDFSNPLLFLFAPERFSCLLSFFQSSFPSFFSFLILEIFHYSYHLVLLLFHSDLLCSIFFGCCLLRSMTLLAFWMALSSAVFVSLTSLFSVLIYSKGLFWFLHFLKPLHRPSSNHLLTIDANYLLWSQKRTEFPSEKTYSGVVFCHSYFYKILLNFIKYSFIFSKIVYKLFIFFQIKKTIQYWLNLSSSNQSSSKFYFKFLA